MIHATSRRNAGPPDFIGLGEPGASAGWWLDMLLAHPEVRGPRGRRRSLHFFSEFGGRELDGADVTRYHSHFPRRRGVLRGEWTARYLFDAWTPPLLRRVAPEAKLLVMLADPIARYKAMFAERRGKLTADGLLYMAGAADRRSYAAQLARLRCFFTAEQMLVLQFERCLRDPLGQYARTLRFLGASDPEFVPRRLRGAAPRVLERLIRDAARVARVPDAHSRRAVEKVTGRPQLGEQARLWPDLEAALHVALVPEMAKLSAMVPELDLGLWPDFAPIAASGT